MMEVRIGRSFMGRLAHGVDLLEALNRAVRERGIRLGRVEAIGAVQKARLGYYDQERQVYAYIEWPRPLEITSLLGNISLKEGQPFVHAHLTLSDERGMVFGGHLSPGTPVFAGEFFIQELEGASLTRGFDATTGLPLWELSPFPG
ncbi:MAG: DNA-binding protein [Magnetococcales bacterium]|nr:DNA-binding protein [Magnetococcales bacterium]MBF0156991.1 DNA-binding protein [Magnetococcales bacterium]